MPLRRNTLGSALLGAALYVCGAGQVEAYQMGGMKHPLTDIPAPAVGVTASAVWPDNPDKRVVLGEPRVKVLMGFRNGGDVAYNLTLISGSINVPGAFSQYMQNLTTLAYGIVVQPKEEITVPYMVMLARDLPPQEFTVALTAFYYTETGAQYANTFFNDTITFVENTGPFDYQLFLMIGTVIALAAGIYVIVVGPSAAAGLKKLGSKSSSSSRAKESVPAANTADWLQGTAFAAEEKKKAQPRKTVAADRKKEEAEAKKAAAATAKKAAAEKAAAVAKASAGAKGKKK